MNASNDAKTLQKSMQKGGARRFVNSSEFGIVIALAAICVVMSFASPYFLTSANIFNVLQQMSQITIVSVGMALVILTGGIDLSIGYTLGLGGCVLAVLLSGGMNMILVFVIVIVLGMLIGCANGLMITRLGIAPFIVTLGTGYVMRGAQLLISGGRAVTFDSPISFLGGGYIGQLPFSVIIMFVVVIIGVVFSTRTLTGRNIYAMGNNERAADLSGINTKNLKLLVYVIQAALAALCGIIAAGKLHAADSQLGNGFEMDVIAAVVIGGFSMAGGEGKMWSVLVGSAIIGLIKNAFVLLGVTSYWQTAMIGIVILVAVSIAPIKKIVNNRRRELV